MSRKLKEPKDIYTDKEVPLENPIPEENVLSLRKKEWVIRIDPKQIKDFLYLHKHTLIFIFTFFTACAFIISTSSTNASVATFYPGTCLGGWQNVENATGEPNVEDPERIESFTKENSAVFENSNEEIFCGDFKGLIPEDSDPKKFTLAFHWSYDYGDIKHDDPLETNQEIKVKEEDISNTGNQEKDSEIIEENLEVKEEIIKENAPESKVEEIPALEPAKEATSLLRKIFSIAHAQEESAPEPAPESISEPEPAVESTPEPITEEVVQTQEIISTEENNSTPENQTIEEVTPVDENISQDENNTTEEDTSNFNVTTDGESQNIDEEIKEEIIETSPNDIFEVVYTLDGENWDVLGRVRKDKWQESSFEIPYEKINSWDNLSKLQIRLKVLPSFDSMPIIYLDAISLSVEYVDSNMQIDTIDFNNIVHVVESPEMFVFLAKKENKYGIWVLEKGVIGKPEETLRKLETVGVLPYEPVIKDGIIFWLVGDPQPVAKEVAKSIIPDSVGEYLNNSEIEDKDIQETAQDTEVKEIQNLDSVENKNLSSEEENLDNVQIELPIETIDSLEIKEDSKIDSMGVTEVLEGQIPTAIVGFREDLGYISQTILDTNNKDNWLNFGDYAIAWKDKSFLIFDMLNSLAVNFDSTVINKNTPNILPKTYREWIINIPDFEKDEKELEVIDSEETLIENEANFDSEETTTSKTEEGGLSGPEIKNEEVLDEIEVINADTVEEKKEEIQEEISNKDESSNSELQL